jgi:lantibiotic modifying enzyme
MKIGAFGPLAEKTQLLVLGYGGTLRPDLNHCPGVLVTDDHAVMPPVLRELVGPLLMEAALRFRERTEDAHRQFAGEPIPLDSLLQLLRERLCGILTQAIPECTDDSRQLAGDLRHQFPLLRPLLSHAIYEWISATTTFLRRLHRDGPRILAWLHLPARTPVESVRGTASDAHAGGHAVLRVSFAGGHCLYYKPRLVTGEWLWRRLLETVAQLDPALCLPASRVLTDERRFHYGWVESVLPEDRSVTENSVDSAGAADYWHVAGATLCLAQHARLTDLHLGNIVATPHGPAVTDAECLATPDFSVEAPTSQGGDKVIEASLNSLLSTGLLPRNSETGVPDISGLFGKAAPHAGSLSGLRLPFWVADASGGYRLAQSPAILVDQSNVNQSNLGNPPIETSAIAALPRIMSGYRHAAQTLLGCRKTLLDPGAHWRSVLENAHAPRMVLRDTLTYGLVLSESLAAGHLSSWHRRRSAIFSRLQSSAPAALPKAVVRAETHALLQLHVPRLLTLPGTRSLSNGSGRVLARSFASGTPAEGVVAQMQRLSPETIESVHIPALIFAILSQQPGVVANVSDAR